MRSNFLKQKTAEVGLTDNKENVPENAPKEEVNKSEHEKQQELQDAKDYHKEEWIEPKKKSDEPETEAQKE